MGGRIGALVRAGDYVEAAAVALRLVLHVDGALDHPEVRAAVKSSPSCSIEVVCLPVAEALVLFGHLGKEAEVLGEYLAQGVDARRMLEQQPGLAPRDGSSELRFA
jgi:hypothetical protein